jgi:glycosyltransferase involved in cell wall biosynthesis
VKPILTNKHIICVSSSAWDTKYIQPIVQLIALLAKDNKVLFVDYAFTWVDVLRYFFRPNHMHIPNILGLKSRIRKVSTEYNTKLNILSLPPVLPINWIKNETIFDLLNKFNYWITIRSIKKAQKELELNSPYVINSWNPFFGINYKSELNEILHTYFCYDEISASQWIKKHGSRLERLYLPKPDNIITTSKELKNTKSLFNSDCEVVPNGVNFDLFNSEYNKTEHVECFDTKGYDQVIGYLGTVDDRVDIKMMQYAIENLPNYLFVFVGRLIDPNVESGLKGYRNLMFVLPQKLSDLPKYVYKFSVCIIPFVKNDFTINVYPMKINEYLAMGKPVVLTDFSDLNEFANTCMIVTSKEEFKDALGVSVVTDSNAKRIRRIEIASENSWEKRTEAFSQILYSKTHHSEAKKL